jgi:hypothetical protein
MRNVTSDAKTGLFHDSDEHPIGFPERGRDRLAVIPKNVLRVSVRHSRQVVVQVSVERLDNVSSGFLSLDSQPPVGEAWSLDLHGVTDGETGRELKANEKLKPSAIGTREKLGRGIEDRADRILWERLWFEPDVISLAQLRSLRNGQQVISADECYEHPLAPAQTCCYVRPTALILDDVRGLECGRAKFRTASAEVFEPFEPMLNLLDRNFKNDFVLSAGCTARFAVPGWRFSASGCPCFRRRRDGLVVWRDALLLVPSSFYSL